MKKFFLDKFSITSTASTKMIKEDDTLAINTRTAITNAVGGECAKKPPLRHRCRVVRGCRPGRADVAGCCAGETPSIRRTRVWPWGSSSWSRAACSPGSPRSRAAPSWSPRGRCTSTPRRSRRRCRCSWACGPPGVSRSRPSPRRRGSGRGATPTAAPRPGGCLRLACLTRIFIHS